MLAKSQKLGDRQLRIYNFLRENPLGVLSTTDPDNNPHGAVVYYMVEDNFLIRILTKTGTRKYDNLIHNNHVALTVFEPHTQTIAQILGVAAERGGAGNVNAVVAGIFGANLRTSEAGLPPIVKLQAGEFTTIQIKPVQIRMAIYARPVSGGYEDLFESIESFEFKADGEV